MESKGLCSTCIHDTKCTLRVKLPILQCEEFDVGKTKSTKIKKASRRTRHISTFEETPVE